MKTCKTIARYFLLLGAGAILFGVNSYAENIVTPPNSGFVDVTKAPYNAPSDGINDATSAITKALKDNMGKGISLYFPNGTYLISNSLVFPDQPGGNLPSNMTLQGQSQAGTIIVLKNNCPGFTDASSPKAMIVTGHDVAQCFFNYVKNLTINSGIGNHGAIGLRFYANNSGSAANLTIKSGDGNGKIGLDMFWQNENGPLLVKNVLIDGFDVGINSGSCQNSQTMEHITLMNQKLTGIKTEGGVLSIRDLISTNSVTAINNKGILTLLGAKCTGGSSSNPAIVNAGTMYVRDFSAVGYSRGIDNESGIKNSLAALTTTEWASHAQTSLNASGSGMLNLPIKETPEMIYDPLSDWQVVDHPGDGSDATQAIQAAIDAGKTTVYFKPGNYLMNSVKVHGNVRTFYGSGCYLDVQVGGGFTIEDGTSPIVHFERFGGGYAKTFFVTHASPRTVVIKSVLNWGVKKMAGSGDLFLEDICANPWTWFEFHGGNVWARQLDPENQGTHIINNGATLWILGLKTERGGTLIETKAGGKTELNGFLSYTTTDPAGSPMFIVNESQFSAIGAETSYGPNYDIFVREIQNGVTKNLASNTLPSGCGNGHILPYYVSKSTSSFIVPPKFQQYQKKSRMGKTLSTTTYLLNGKSFTALAPSFNISWTF